MTSARLVAAVLAAGALGLAAAWSCGGLAVRAEAGDASASTFDASTYETAGEGAIARGGLEPLDAPYALSDALSDVPAVEVCPNIDSFDGGCDVPQTDPQTDPHNCASCGNDCMGGACAAGACVPLPANTLATGQRAPIALAADGRDVYWLNRRGSSGTGGRSLQPVTSVFSAQVLECAVGGCNNRPTVLATLPAAGDVGGIPVAPSALAVDSTNVYWTTGDSLLACAIGGCSCSPTVVFGGLTQPPGVTAAAGRLFWSVWANGSPYTGQVQTCSTTGCANVTTLAGGQGGPLGLTADDSHVYWADTYGPDGGGSIAGCAVAGCNGTPTLMWAGGTSDGNPRNFTSDATNLFWTDGWGGIMQCAKADCARTQITLVAGHKNLNVGAIAVDATDVYHDLALVVASVRLVLPRSLTMETSMSLSDLASLGSFVSGFAVLISLVYLALQVRQTERNQQISIRHSRVSRTVELHLALADPAVAGAWLHGLGSPQEITQTELIQFINVCRAHFFHFEDSFYQREGGLLNDDAFETVVAGARLVSRSPGFRAAWKIARANFGGRFRDFMDGVVASAAAEPPVDLSLEAWKVAFVSEASRTS